MKGIVFTEFIDMVDEKFGPEVTEEILTAAGMPHGGAYTAVGTYDHQELLAMVGQLSRISGVPVPDLVKAYGQHLFGALVRGHGQLLADIRCSLDLLERVEDYVHVEVRKLYPEAELPHFTCRRLASNQMEMIYQSSRPFGDLAEGLILGCALHFGEKVGIQRENLGGEGETEVRFLVTVDA